MVKPLHGYARLTLECPIICDKGKVIIEKDQQTLLENYGWNREEIRLLERLFTLRYYDRLTPIQLIMEDGSVFIRDEPDLLTNTNMSSIKKGF